MSGPTPEDPSADRAAVPTSGAGAAPSAGLLLIALGALLVPLGLAAALPHLPAAVRPYLPRTPLPLLEIEFALAFALLALPVFKSPPAAEVSPALTGLVRGAFLGLLVLPFVLAGRADAPMTLPAILAGGLLVAVTGAGAAAAAAAFGARGLAAAAAAVVLPGVLGFLAEAVGLPLGWLGLVCPFIAAGAAAAGGAAWTLGMFPGLGLLAAVLIPSRAGGKPGE